MPARSPRESGQQEAFAFARGRVALYAVLKALGVGAGDEVILTGFTCVVVANSVQFLGARCRYVDIDARTYGTDPTLLDSVWTHRTKAVVVQHSFGIPADLDLIVAWARKRAVPIVEDCAITVGSTYHGQEVGAFGAAAFWSGQWSKPIPVGAGGFLIVNDPNLIEPVRAQWQQAGVVPVHKQILLAGQAMLRQGLLNSRRKARLQSVYRRFARARSNDLTQHGECEGVMPADYLTRTGSVQARAWQAGLRRWGKDTGHRRRIVATYERALPSLGFQNVNLAANVDVVYSRYPLRVANKPEVLHAAEREGVEIGNWMDQPLHQATAPLQTWAYRQGMCPEGERAARETVNLPTHRGVSMAEAYRVLSFLRRVARPTQLVFPHSSASGVTQP